MTDKLLLQRSCYCCCCCKAQPQNWFY